MPDSPHAMEGYPFTCRRSWIRDRITDVLYGRELVMRCHWNIARKFLSIARNFLLLRDIGAILRYSAFAQLREVTQCLGK